MKEKFKWKFLERGGFQWEGGRNEIAHIILMDRIVN